MRYRASAAPEARAELRFRSLAGRLRVELRRHQGGPGGMPITRVRTYLTRVNGLKGVS